MTDPATNNLPACEVCGEHRYRKQWTLHFETYPGPFDLYRCRTCGLVMNWPQLPSQAAVEQYDGDYYVFQEPASVRWARAAQLYLQHLKPLESQDTGRRLLEVGCARGHLLALAQARGWEVQGIEISAAATESARKEFKVPVHCGTVEDTGSQIKPCDVVIATDVLEHVTSPRAFVRAVHEVVRIGGLAILETPNFDSFWRRLGGRHWLGLNRFHVYLFNAVSLRQLVEGCGFEACCLSSSTNVAYARWGDRPEWSRWREQLPAGLRWRATQWANHLTPRSPAIRLREQGPASLDEALFCIDETNVPTSTHRSNRLSGDNLTVTARAGRSKRSQGSCKGAA